MNRAYVALDLETTGLDPERDAIMEVGVVRFRIFRVDPDDPVLPAPPATAVVMAPTGDDDDRPRRRSRDY